MKRLVAALILGASAALVAAGPASAILGKATPPQAILGKASILGKA